MYIKQIIIQGFKSYKEQTVIEPFSPGHNVIVGRNGSGKSNFFAAIRFVLSDAYTQMGREEREALLHEGSGSAVMSAYVEIIFDNSDDRFPTGRDEVILRRTIGQKKDEYSLDRKAATKTDVMNLLESAGFSRSNPYYIVPQGRVTTLTNMKDAERLKLLKEVAGTQVYEARRAESLKIMTETNNKRAKIDELLEYINERLGELEEEKEELRGYQEKDKERRCLEYTFYHREQIALAEALDELENSRSQGSRNTDENRRAFMEAERTIAALDAELGQLNRQMELLRIDRRQLEEDRREAAKHRAGVELEVKTLSDGQSANEQARHRHQQDLYAVQQDIARKEAELASILPEYNRRRNEEAAIRAELTNTDASVQHLYAKQGRGAQFKSKAERDAFLRKEIESYRATMSAQTSNRADAAEEVNTLQTEIQNLEGDIAGLRQRLEGWSGNRQALSAEVANAKDALEKLSDERKVLRREDDKLGSIIESARFERDRSERDLSHAMDAATARGLATVRRLKRERNIRGAYGTIAELVKVPEELRIAVEQTAGNSLFHYVVDNADTATLLADALYKERGGRVTFMPLSQLKPRALNLPRAADAQPMMSVLDFDPKYEKAFAQIFGRVVICPNLSIAAQYSRSHGVDAITEGGDSTNKRGAMTGGYIDKRSSRLQAVQAVNKSREEYEKLRVQSLDIAKKIERKDQEITRSIGDLQKLEQKLRQLDDSFEPLKADLRSKVAYLDRLRDQLDSKTRRAENIDALLKQNATKISAFETELATEFKKSLTHEEEQQLEYLSGRLQDLRHQWNELSKGRRELENRKNLLEVDLRENLRLKLDQLSSIDFESGSGGAGTLEEARRELKRCANMTETIEMKYRENGNYIDDTAVRISALQQDKGTLELKQQDIARALERDEKIIEKGIAKKTLLQASAAECAKNIRDLGVLPEEAFEKYEDMDSKIVTNRLKKVNEALKKYKHVNKKAFEQYNSFTNQRETLTKRRKELDSSQSSIEELVDVLDQRKDEAIERTFKQVSKYFASIFERLVPAGRGRLVIQRRTDARHRDEETDDEARESVENYTGVGISVSFNSKHDEQQRIQQLSGGQKSLCALALVFAIQQCDPAPFYLFDEIDANLDAQYRTAVAEMLKSISEQQNSQNGTGEHGAMSGQFICTTFRPEMVLVADKCYGVTFHNKTSGINVVSREKALEFVEGQKQ